MPVRLSEEEGIVQNAAPRPHAALLWLEFQASPTGRKIIDKYLSRKFYNVKFTKT